MSKVFIVTMLSSATIEAPITVLPHQWQEVEEDPAQTIAKQQARIDELEGDLKSIAAIAHHGGLLGHTQMSAAKEIRKLTLRYWDGEEAGRLQTQEKDDG